MTLPNLLTLSRFLLALLIFIGLAILGGERRVGDSPGFPEAGTLLADAVLILFLIASFTDILDGYLARKKKLLSQFGRIADPMVDKIIICGCLVFLTGFPEMKSILPLWIVVAIIVRELAVDNLRGMFEARGANFKSRFLGKTKMVLQCITIAFSIFYIGHLAGDSWAKTILTILIWITFALVLFSAGDYFHQAWKFSKNEKRDL